MPISHYSLVVLSITLLSSAVQAQEIRWRDSYADAQRESIQTGRPLFMEFSSEACFWCRKLEGVTLNNADVARLINERFIPVRIDVQVETELARAVAVRSFPTVFVVAPDRTIVARHEGFAEAGQMVQILNQGLDKVPSRSTIARSDRPVVQPR